MKTLLGWAALLAALVGGQAHAAMFRCGNVFQDRPCESEAEQQRVKPGGGRNMGGAVPIAPMAPAAVAIPVSAAPEVDPAWPKGVTRTSKKPTCMNLYGQREALDTRLHAGGRKETLEMLLRQRQEVDKGMVEGGC